MGACVAGRVEVVENQLSGAIAIAIVGVVGGARAAELLEAGLLRAWAGGVARRGRGAGEEAWEQRGRCRFGLALERDAARD